MEEEELGQIAAAILRRCARAAQQRALCATLVRDYPGELLEGLAERLKLQHFDHWLHNDLESAGCMAAFLERLGEVAGRPRIRALGLLARGDAARQDGHALRAMRYFEESAAIYLGVPDHIGWARAQGGWLIAATYAGRITKRDLAAMDEVRRVLRGAGLIYRLAMVEQNIGVAQRHIGLFVDALATFDGALLTLDTSVPPAGSAQSWQNLRGMLLANSATTLLWYGDLNRAEDRYNQARSLFLDIGNHGLVALEDMQLSVVERLRSRLRGALERAQSAVEGLRKAGLASTAALALVFRADTLLALNRCEEAAAEIAQAVAILRTQQDPLDLLDALGVQARAWMRCGEDGKALDTLLEAGQLLPRAGSLQVKYPVALERAALLLTLGRITEAHAVALALIDRPGTRETATHWGRAALIVAEAALALGRAGEARAWAEGVIQLGRQLDAPEFAYRGRVVLARLAHRSGDYRTALDHYDAATVALHSPIMALALDQCAQFLEDKDTVYLEALSVALEAGDALQALMYLERGRARATWMLAPTGDAEVDELRRRHRYISASLATMAANSLERSGALAELKRLERRIRDRLEAGAQRTATPALLDGASLLQAIPQSVTILAHAMVGDDLVIFVVRRQQVSAERVIGGASEIRQLGRSLRHAIETLPTRVAGIPPAAMAATLERLEASVRQRLHELYSLLIEPVEHRLPSAGEPLTLVPHGVLHALPLLALYDGTRYAAERWSIRCVPACQTPGQQPECDEPAGRPVLALGYSHEGRLPQAPEEAQRIAELMGGDALVGKQATGDHLHDESQGRTFLHIAAHGELRLDVPNSSFVQLADGPFHPTDVLTLDLRGCQLVALSACQTGLGRPSGGDEQIGLMRAFLLAGAHGVLATLWPVEDAATLEFMSRFYEEVRAGAPPVEALRTTQLAFVNEPSKSRRTHPYFWAGFHLMQTTYGEERLSPAAAAPDAGE